MKALCCYPLFQNFKLEIFEKYWECDLDVENSFRNHKRSQTNRRVVKLGLHHALIEFNYDNPSDVKMSFLAKLWNN